MNLVAPFHEHAIKHPNDLALSVSGKDYTYRQLADQARRVAGWITVTTGQENPRIGILAARSLTAFVGILASSYAGAAYVPLNFKAPHDYLSDILRAAKIDALIVDRTGIDILEKGPLDALPVSILSPFDTPGRDSSSTGPEDLNKSPLLNKPTAVEPHNHAYLMFTSGTTGKPKGITITVENIHHLLTTLQSRYQYTAKDRISQAFELTFDLSVFDIFMALRSGASLHVVPDHQMSTPARFIQQRQLTSWFSVPSMIGMLKQIKMLRPGAFPSLRLSLFCGEALPEESARTWQEAAPKSCVENLYGPTEATVACLLQDCADPHAITPNRGIVAIGRPFEGLHAAIVDEQGRFLPTGEHGELAIHGPQIAPGYLDNPKLSAQRFPTLEHPEIGLSRWYLTGDLACMDEEERYHFFGRVDNQVQLRGYRVELDEIEHHLRAASGCDNAVVIFLDHRDIWAQEIVGVVLPGTFDTGELRKQLGNRLPPYMVPKRVVICEELPRNASGKLDRNALMRQITAGRVDKS
ncbi:MAG: amino acid adenylation domain-containing protein [Desulfuromonadales bacterium]|nr:amino acid adenylation domain-containing protein [Desulfuromonadales bacterium]